MATIRLTMAEAIVRFLIAQHVADERSGEVIPLVPGVFAIFGHGNALSLGEALEKHRDSIRTIRGQNEEAMALAAVGYAKSARRRQVMAVTTSIGPGALNTVPAAGVAMANRLPLLLLLGDTFVSRAPDPVLQQIERFDSPSTTANDALKPVSRYWDRLTSPSQLLSTLPQAIGVLLDPADCGPVTLCLPQDVQAQAYDYPEDFFAPVVHAIRRPRPARDEIAQAAELIRGAVQPLVIAGGGVHYSLAEAELSAFAARSGIPVMETVAGKASLTADDPSFAGPVGVFGESAGHRIAWEADVVVAVGTRLQDFTTESGTVFKNPDVRLVSINAARFDALKRGGAAVVGDAREALIELGAALGDWTAPHEWLAAARASMDEQREAVASRTAPRESGLPTYAQVIGVVHEIANDDDYVLTSSGGMPGELVMNWPAKAVASFDCEYGFSCMGYEVSGAWGAALEHAASRPGTTRLRHARRRLLHDDADGCVQRFADRHRPHAHRLRQRWLQRHRAAPTRPRSGVLQDDARRRGPPEPTADRLRRHGSGYGGAGQARQRPCGSAQGTAGAPGNFWRARPRDRCGHAPVERGRIVLGGRRAAGQRPPFCR